MRRLPGSGLIQMVYCLIPVLRSVPFCPASQDRTAFMVLDDAIHIGMFDGHAGAMTSTYLQVPVC